MGAVSNVGRRVAEHHGLDVSRLLRGRAWAAACQKALRLWPPDDVVGRLCEVPVPPAANPYGLLISRLRRMVEKGRSAGGSGECPITAQAGSESGNPQRLDTAAAYGRRTAGFVLDETDPLDEAAGRDLIDDAYGRERVVAGRVWPPEPECKAAASRAFDDALSARQEGAR
ncbi:MAG: hypothetical protein M0020_05780 [Actinomycetota bacterium]|nr:hypothetical protein [Actinomycetota bacterium]